MEVRPWERWTACAWLLWVIPVWALANNVTYWTRERAVMTPEHGRLIMHGVWLALAALAFWGWGEIRRGRAFTVSWFPHQLRGLFLTFVWLVTGVAILKTVGPAGWSGWTSTQTTFVVLAAAVTVLLPKPPHRWRATASRG